VIIAIGNTKGGVGKTTVSVNLAILRSLEGRDVLLIDGDQQQSSTLFSLLRNRPVGEGGYTTVSLAGEAILIQVPFLAPKYDDVVIDVGGTDNGSLRAALAVADKVLIPVQPRTLDVWALDRVVTIIREAKTWNPKLKAVAFLNAADSQGRDNADALAAMAGKDGIEISDVMLVRRKAYPNAGAVGLGVLEYGKDTKAIEELTALAAVGFAIDQT
jgi:chromosome partitioning protein